MVKCNNAHRKPPQCGGMITDILCYKCCNQKTETYALTYHKLQGVCFEQLFNYSMVYNKTFGEIMQTHSIHSIFCV